VGIDISGVRPRGRGQQVFTHEAFLYAGTDEFVDGIAEFAREAVAAHEPILVMVGARKLQLLREELGPDANGVAFANMEAVGANPARIIPAWIDFVHAHAGGPRVRGVGEPIWSGRAPLEVVESQLHESLLNVAFADTTQMWLVCPYDTGALDPSVIDEAHRSHPVLSREHVGAVDASGTYRGLPDMLTAAFEQPLPDAPDDVEVFSFGLMDLRALRLRVTRHAANAGLNSDRTEDFVVAANEIATNSIRYGGGEGTVRLWLDAGSLVCEVQDQGRIARPLVGRERPPTDRDGGAGLYLANQFCDLVQLRSSATGTIVRLHMRRP
jgi:anti-sigma regulatory factor (Ser/Thr protein kinase)